MRYTKALHHVNSSSPFLSTECHYQCRHFVLCKAATFGIMHSEHIILKRRETKYLSSDEKRWRESQYKGKPTNQTFSFQSV